MCFKGNCDVTNKAERLSAVKSSNEGWGDGGGGGNEGRVGVLGVGAEAAGWGGVLPWKPTVVLVKRLL